MIFFALSAFSVAIFGFCTAEEFTLPICKRNSIDYSKCLTHAVRESWPYFVKGIPEYDVPSLDPLLYENGKFKFDQGDIHAEIIFSNIRCIGLKKTHFIAVRARFLDDDIFQMAVDGQIPKLFVDGNISAKGTLGGFGMISQGHFNATVDDLKGTWEIQGHVANDRWTIEHFQANEEFAKLKFYTEDMFSEGINDFVINFMNEYGPSLYQIILPVVNEIGSPFMSEEFNRFFSKVSFSELFPEN